MNTYYVILRIYPGEIPEIARHRGKSIYQSYQVAHDTMQQLIRSHKSSVFAVGYKIVTIQA